MTFPLHTQSIYSKLDWIRFIEIRLLTVKSYIQRELSGDVGSLTLRERSKLFSHSSDTPIQWWAINIIIYIYIWKALWHLHGCFLYIMMRPFSGNINDVEHQLCKHVKKWREKNKNKSFSLTWELIASYLVVYPIISQWSVAINTEFGWEIATLRASYNMSTMRCGIRAE